MPDCGVTDRSVSQHAVVFITAASAIFSLGLFRDGNGRYFRDPLRPVNCLLNRPVTGGLTGQICQLLTALLP